MTPKSVRLAHLATAAEYCESKDPLIRIRGLELAAGLGREGRERILRGLVDRDSPVRETAIGLAARLIPAARLLAGVASEGEASLRTACVEALKRQGARALPALRRGLKARDQDVVMFTLEILGSVREDESVALLLGCLSHENPNVAQAAVDSLGELRAPRAVGPLLELLVGDTWLRMAAIVALGRIGDARATVDLLGLVDDEMAGATALDALEQIGDPSAVGPLLHRLTREARTPERDVLLRALGSCLEKSKEQTTWDVGPDVRTRMEHEPIQSYLSSALRSEDAALRAPAAAVVRAFACRPLYPDLVEHLDQEAFSGPTVAFLVALPESAGAESILTAAAVHSRPGVRLVAMRILASRKEPWGDPVIFARLDDGEPTVVAGAIRALAVRRPAGSFARILPLLLHEAEEVSTRAIEALPAVAFDEDVEKLRELILGTPHGDELLAYVELSRRLDASRFESAWLDRLSGAVPGLLRPLLRALGGSSSPRVRERLLEFLDHPSSAVRTLAIEALSRPENADLGLELHRRLLIDRECRYYLVRALGRLRYQPATDDLIGLYLDASPLEKIAILESLGALETPAAGRFLRAELESQDRERRRTAAMSLARHFREGRLPLFLKLARSEDWPLRNAAGYALSEIGGAEARAALAQLSQDPNEVVARTARNALQRGR